MATGPAAIPSPATPAAKLREEPLDLGPAPAAAPSPTADPGADRSLPLPATDAGANPRSAAATRLAAEARNRMSAGDDSAALEQLERAISVDPENGYAYCLLAEVQSRRGSFDQSILFAERAAALLNDRDPRWASHAHTVGAAAFETVGRFADARLAYRRALDLDPSNAEAHAGFARAGGQEGGR